MGRAKAGDPPFQKTEFRFTPSDSDEFGTSHVSVVDRDGHAVSMTTTIEDDFGARIMTRSGFLLNNELTDFSFAPVDAQGQPIANRVQPGKRPRSSMAPTLVFDHGRLELALGSPGGSTIITTVLQVLLNRLDFAMSLPQAVAAPRASQRNTADVQAEAAFDRTGLAALGHTFVPPPAPGEIGAVTGIGFRPGGAMVAVAEPVRRGGGSAAVVRPTG
jgi:gamma-glutamyltranspeptidase/glutathione hydrolase